MFEMLSGFRTDHEKVKEIKALKETGQCPKTFKERFHNGAVIVEKMLAKNEKDRPTSSQIFKCSEYLLWAKELGHSF